MATPPATGDTAPEGNPVRPSLRRDDPAIAERLTASATRHEDPAMADEAVTDESPNLDPEATSLDSLDAPTSEQPEKSTTRPAVEALRRWVGVAGSLAAGLLRRLTRRSGSDEPTRLIDVLRLLGLARRAVPKPVVGPKAYVQWWQRLLALVALAALVTGLGFAFTAAIGLIVVVAGFLLEQAIV